CAKPRYSNYGYFDFW
nr:immunoglobulin heavy chain junction region [Macaca mulatta]